MSWIFVVLIVTQGYLPAIAKSDESPNKRSVAVDSIPAHVKPGDKPITLNKELLSKLFPEVKNPRLMTFDDLGTTDEKSLFIEGGYSFVLRNDFKRAKLADIAFVGKYDSSDRPESACFIAVVSIKGKKVVREFFSKIDRDHISLLRVINYKPKVDAIGMSYNLASDDCGYVYWTGNKWDYEECKATF